MGSSRSGRTRAAMSADGLGLSLPDSAQKAGEPVDAKLLDRLAAVLKQALRSDYSRLLTGSEMRERVEALTALAEGGKLDEAYVAELARRASVMPNATLAQMTAAWRSSPRGDRRIVSTLMETLWSRVTILSPATGARSMAGMRAKAPIPLILPSETRSLAEVTRAVALAAPVRRAARRAARRAGQARRRRRLGQHQRQRGRGAGACRGLA